MHVLTVIVGWYSSTIRHPWLVRETMSIVGEEPTDAEEPTNADQLRKWFTKCITGLENGVEKNKPH